MYSVIVSEPPPPAVLRIGELSRRLGVSDHVLRAWERRYGLLRPIRTAGGFRLYSEADFDRVRRMQEYLAQGLSAAQAARAAVNGEPPAGVGTEAGGPARHDGPADEAAALAAALDQFDEPAAHAVLDRLLSTLTVETVLRDVVLPYLRALGDRWERGEVSVAQEHFASNVIRGRLAGLARGWGHGHGPRAILACVPDELHDIALLAFGIVLNRNGWRIEYLGANTPLDDLIDMAGAQRPDLVVLAGTRPERFDGRTDDLARLARVAPIALAGPGATAAIADAAGATLLTDDPVTAAERMPTPGTTASPGGDERGYGGRGAAVPSAGGGVKRRGRAP
jgi:MerR family transcriptional regulator, light-induced transcriptional regulator